MSTGQKLGKYDIEAQVAKGARAAVYRGMDPETRQAVAIKAIARDHVNVQALPAYVKHARSLATLEHPGIARFIEVVDTPKAVCIVSTFAEGKPLSGLLKDGAYPDARIAWEVIRQLLEILAVAHVHGAVHRDIKPSNLLLGAESRLSLVNFGTSMLYSTPADNVQHFAPEHFGEGKIGARSDLYQVGILVYQLVTGKAPFTGTAAEIEHRVMQERPTDPSSYNNKLAWQLDWVVQKALSKDSTERFASALEFGDGLRLGLQDTVGRPLDPVKITAVKASMPAAPAAANLIQNAKAIAGAAAAAAKAAPTAGASALAHAATDAPPAPKAAAAPRAPVVEKTALDPRKPTVLFVDDDARLLNALKSLFRLEYNVIGVESGAAALEVLAKVPVHVVVSDQRMPAMTGVELLRKVHEAAPNSVRILLTGYTDLASLVGSINQGEIFRFVKKPWDNEELKKALGDASKIAFELAAAPVGQPSSPRTAGSLLVIDPSEGLAKGLERLLAGSASVKQVKTPQEAAKVLAREEIAAIVADMGAGMDGLVALFREIKAKRPEVLSILLTDEPDSELAIELINKAHIFRFLPKPVSAKELRTQVAAALRRYAAFKQVPTLGAPAGAPGSALAERARALPGKSVADAT
jgi:eukaryotic-like serine/threonine-protein kinase